MGSPRFYKSVAFLALVLGLSGCSSGDCTGPLCAGTPDPPVTGTISGRVTIDGVGAPGVTVTVSNVGSAATGSSGEYAFTDVAVGSYQVSLSGLSPATNCPAPSRAVVISASSVSVTADFACEADRTASISGSVIAGAGGLPGVTVVLGGKEDGTTSTDSNGQYAFTSLTAGSYDVTISGFDDSRYVFETTSQPRTLGVGEAATIDFVGLAAGIDLFIADVAAPEAANIGSTIEVSAIVENLGDTDAGAFRLGFYLLSDAGGVTGNQAAGLCNVESLAAQDHFTCTVAAEIPSSLNPGQYFVRAVADDQGAVEESNETNNRGSVPITLSRGPDLVVAGVDAPETAVVRDSIEVRVVIRNEGDVDAEAFRLGIYFSTDTDITADDVLGAACLVAGIAAGGEETCSRIVTVRTSLSAGTWYVGAIADDQSTVAESDETNNTGHSSAITLLARGADLIIEGLAVTATASPGQAVQVSVSVANQGTIGAAASEVAIYLSNSATVTAADQKLGSCGIEALAPGASADCSGTITIPSALAPGTYYLRAVADDAAAVPELDESNNTASSKIVVSN